MVKWKRRALKEGNSINVSFSLLKRSKHFFLLNSILDTVNDSKIIEGIPFLLVPLFSFYRPSLQQIWMYILLRIEYSNNWGEKKRDSFVSKDGLSVFCRQWESEHLFSRQEMEKRQKIPIKFLILLWFMFRSCQRKKREIMFFFL